MTSPTICILGLSGGVGGAVAKSLLRHRFGIRALVRDPLGLPAHWTSNPLVEIVPGDAMDAADIARAAAGCTAIFHGVNPAGYRDWDRVV